jgi:hypothetical protein
LFSGCPAAARGGSLERQAALYQILNDEAGVTDARNTMRDLSNPKWMCFLAALLVSSF